MRHIALNLLREQKSAKIEMKNRSLSAGWDNRYLASILFRK